MDRLLDTAHSGPLHLRRPEVASIVVEAIHYRERQGHYILHNYVVMANHVHLLITPNIPVSSFMKSLKGFTARRANQILGVFRQSFWQEESYDRLVRNADEFRRIAGYIEMNPVVAGVSSAPEDFPWSSARRVDNPLQVNNLPHITPHTLTA